MVDIRLHDDRTRYAVCVATCTYCGHTWRPCIACADDSDAFAVEGIECPACEGTMGRVRVCVGIETGEDAARARAEAIVAEEY